MKRFATVFWVVLIAFSAYGVYMVKYRVEAVKQEVVQLERTLASEKESLMMQKAEWSRANHPKRLRKLAKGRLPLTPIRGDAVVEVSAIALSDSALHMAQGGGDAR